MEHRPIQPIYKLTLATLCILVVGAILYASFFKPTYIDDQKNHATPEEIAAFRKGAVQHLKNTYEQEMVVHGDAQYIGAHIYVFVVSAHPQNNRRVVFEVNRGQGDRHYTDNYPNILWSSQAKEELTSIVKKLLSGKVRIAVDVQDTAGMYGPKKRKTIPSYKETRDKKILSTYTDGEVLTRLYVEVKRKVSGEDVESESKRIFALVSYLNENNIEVDALEIGYENGFGVSLPGGRRLTHVINMQRLKECIATHSNYRKAN